MRVSGRPLRAFRLLALGLGMVVMWRLPILAADIADTRAALVGQAAPVVAFAAYTPDATSGGDAIIVSWRDFGEGPAAAPSVQLAPSILLMPYPVAMAQAGPTTPAPPAPGFELANWSLPPSAPDPQQSAPEPATALAAADPAPPAKPTAGDYATAAYAELANGNRRAAVGLFDMALAAGPDPRDAQWKAERKRLTRRWSGDAFSLLRDPGTPGTVGPAALPVLGGGQSGASIGYTFAPLARRPVSLTARINSATGGGNGADPASTQAAVGLRWQVVPAMSLYAERLIAIGADARNDWQMRVAGGGTGQRGRWRWNGYGEAGVIASGDVFAGGQGFGGLRVIRLKGSDIVAGAGAWGSYQTGTPDASALDLGPSVATRLPLGRWSLDMSADYRFRVAGNALPGSGPALTIATQF
jgi:hypothetical protein